MKHWVRAVFVGAGGGGVLWAGIVAGLATADQPGARFVYAET